MKVDKFKRLESVRVVVDEILNQMMDLEERRCAYIHLYGVSQMATTLAIKRNLNPELASISGMLHDIYSYKTGIRPLHGQNSAEMLRPILRDMGLFSEEEQKIIRKAIFYHSVKDKVHGLYDEVLKDADILQHYLYNTQQKVSCKNAPRLKAVLEELGLSHDFEISDQNKKVVEKEEDRRSLLGDIAERYALKLIAGIPADRYFQDICKYWPDDNIYKVLKNSWCAAFVYHCVREAGFILPIRFPYGVGRLAGVDAWLEWAKKEKIFHLVDEKGFKPQNGDIVIYDKLIIDHFHDHIGIVLNSHKKTITVAEGNIDNKNQSGIIERSRYDKVSGYVRIDHQYKYRFKGIYKAPLL